MPTRQRSRYVVGSICVPRIQYRHFSRNATNGNTRTIPELHIRPRTTIQRHRRSRSGKRKISHTHRQHHILHRIIHQLQENGVITPVKRIHLPAGRRKQRIHIRQAYAVDALNIPVHRPGRRALAVGAGGADGLHDGGNPLGVVGADLQFLPGHLHVFGVGGYLGGKRKAES